MKSFILGLFMATATLAACAQPPGQPQFGPFKDIEKPVFNGEIKLYNTAAMPGDVGDVERPDRQENWESERDMFLVRNVTVPTLIPVFPAPDKANGTAVIVAPGGAFMSLSMQNEGMAVAQWLAERGVTAFVLKYRLKETPADQVGFHKKIGALIQKTMAGNESAADLAVPSAALADAEQAMRIVRGNAKAWNINPDRVGFMGFSAGAMTTIALVTSGAAAVQPDFVAPVYPPMGAVTLPNSAPPMFAVLASDDPLFANKGFALIESWQAAKALVEFHYFERGSHGFGMMQKNVTSDLWTMNFAAWLKMHNLIQ